MKELHTSVDQLPVKQAKLQDVPAAGYGAAEASLNDPACQPGTEAFEKAKAENQRILKAYNKSMRVHEGTSAKPDMSAAKDVKNDPDLWENPTARIGIYGHLQGVAVGDVFNGRGELDALGLHTQVLKGINHSKKGAFGAVAICMSGGYKDNDDNGETFVYTGAGGRDDKGKKQVTDQSYQNPDNAALMANFHTGTPVRVFRGSSGKPPVYTYEGLYKVIAHRMEPSSDGPKVIRFTMQGVPGHFVVSGKVEFKALTKAKAFQKIQLAGAGSEAKQKQRKVPKGYQWMFDVPLTKSSIRQSIKQRAESGRFGVLVSEDVSGGLEKVPIPVWNDVDDLRTPFVPTQLGHLPVQPHKQDNAEGDSDSDMDDSLGDLGFQYLTEYTFTRQDNAAALAVEADKLFKESCGITCGIQFHGGECPYDEEKRLSYTHLALMECPKGCKGMGKADAKLCRRNRVVSEGVKYPVEVFRVKDKGWGVRCSVDLEAGTVLCPYIGVIITDDTAEDQAGADTYLLDLNHFHLWEEAEEQAEEKDPNRNPRLPLMPKSLRDHHLTIDASHEGNVARFFNHSCDPNCVTQAVFTGAARSHELHYIAIVTAEDIPKYTELTYDYGSTYIIEGDAEQTAAAEAAVTAAGGAAAATRRIPCNCGAENCRGWLKD